MNPTRVFILASRSLFAQGVESLLAAQAGIEIVGVTTVGPEALDQMCVAAPDVVVVEAAGKEQGQLVAQVLERIPSAKVIGLTLENNRIHTYYQQMTPGRCVEDLVEAIRAPREWSSRSPDMLRLFVLYQGHYGQRILENVRRFAPRTWKIDAWRVPANLPPVVDDPAEFLPLHLPPTDLVLSLGENASAAQLLPGVVDRTGAQAVIAPIDNVDWLPDGLASQLSQQLKAMEAVAVFPKPFCSLTEHVYNAREHEVSYDAPRVGEFARHFGRPAFQITCAEGKIVQAEVKRDTACGCARDVARQLVGVDVHEAVTQAGLFQHHYPCLATMRIDAGLGDPLIQIAGDFTRQAVEAEITTHIKEVNKNASQTC